VVAGYGVVGGLRRSADERVRRDYDPARDGSASESAYFLIWERLEWPISSASSINWPGFSRRYQVPNVRLRSWGFMSTFFRRLSLTHPHRRRRRVPSVMREPFSVMKRRGEELSRRPASARPFASGSASANA
jgi:hypothetical protein